MYPISASVDFRMLALAAGDYVSIALVLAVFSGGFFFFCWFLLSTSKVFDGLNPYVIQTCNFESLRKIRDVCKVNDMTVKNKLSCYQEGRLLILCHEPLPFGIGRRCWRIPIADLKPRDDAVYDFAIATSEGPLLCYFGQGFRSQFKLFEGPQLREKSPLG